MNSYLCLGGIASGRRVEQLNDQTTQNIGVLTEKGGEHETYVLFSFGSRKYWVPLRCVRGGDINTALEYVMTFLETCATKG